MGAAWIRAAAQRGGAAAVGDMGRASGAGPRGAARQLLRAGRALAAGHGHAGTHACAWPVGLRAQPVPASATGGFCGAADAGGWRRPGAGAAQWHSRRLHGHHARHAGAGGAGRAGDRTGRGRRARWRGQHPGHLSAGAIAGRHSVPPHAAPAGRRLCHAHAAGLRHARAAAGLCATAQPGHRTPRHPAHGRAVGGVGRARAGGLPAGAGAARLAGAW